MRDYGQIQSAFWTSTDCAEYSDQGKLLAAYLMTGPHTTALGCFPLGDGSVLDHLGWSPEKTEKGFAELFRNGFAYRFERVVLIPKFLYWNKIQNGNIAKARFAEWEGLPKGGLKAFAARAMLEFCSHWTDEHTAILETVCQTITGTVTETLFSNSKTQNRTEPNLSEQQKLSPTAHEKTDLNGHDLLGDKPKDSKPDDVQPVVNAYHAVLPRCQRITVMNDKRRKRILAVVKIAKTLCKSNGWDYDGAEFFTRYFEECAKDPWKRGEVAHAGNPRWKQNIDVLLAEDRFAETIDKAFDGQGELA